MEQGELGKKTIITTNEQERERIIEHKNIALQKIDNLLNDYIDNPTTMYKSDKLSYWIEDYCRLIQFEDEFNPIYLKKYKRGDVIKVNLGYNIGNEEGGLHYCIVIDKNNAKSAGIITVIPLTSDKGKTLHYSEVNLGNEIFVKFNEKYEKIKLQIASNIKDALTSPSSINLEEANQNLELLNKINYELSKMKKGSIALVSQITTISKQKIYDPQKTGDILSGLRISDKSLDLINDKMKQLLIK